MEMQRHHVAKRSLFNRVAIRRAALGGGEVAFSSASHAWRRNADSARATSSRSALQRRHSGGVTPSAAQTGQRCIRRRPDRTGRRRVSPSRLPTSAGRGLASRCERPSRVSPTRPCPRPARDRTAARLSPTALGPAHLPAPRLRAGHEDRFIDGVIVFRPVEAEAESSHMRSIRLRAASPSSRANRASALSMVICLINPVAFSLAATLSVPSSVRLSCTTIWLPAGPGIRPSIMNLPMAVVAADVLVLALKHVDLDLVLAIVHGVKLLAAIGRQRRISRHDWRRTGA